MDFLTLKGLFLIKTKEKQQAVFAPRLLIFKLHKFQNSMCELKLPKKLIW